MGRPIRSTGIERFLKYAALLAGIGSIPLIHIYINPPELFRKRQYRRIIEENDVIFKNRGVNTHPFGEPKQDGPFTPLRPS